MVKYGNGSTRNNTPSRKNRDGVPKVILVEKHYLFTISRTLDFSMILYLFPHIISQ